MRPILASSLAALLLTSPAFPAEVRTAPRAVLELFTSQGCSSCPQADMALSELGKRTDLITLAYHVDYWDYIGWADTFGARANSERQRAYAQSWGSSRIYTPELVVNGVEGVVGSKEKDVAGAIDKGKLSVPVSLTVTGEMLEVTVDAQPGGASAVVWLVTFKDHAAVAISRGENAGRTMDYTQIVLDRQMLGMWDAAAGTRLKLPLSELKAGGGNGAVILVQADKKGLPGPIMGAASVTL